MSLAQFVPYQEPLADYLFNISNRFGYCFLANPKCASTGILEVLQLAEVDGDEKRLGQFTHDRVASPLLSLTQTGLEPGEILQGNKFYRFTYVRNPYTRLVSAYLDKIVSTAPERERLAPDLGLSPDEPCDLITFLEAVREQRDSWRDIHWQTQCRLIQPRRIVYNFIGRFENWNRSFPMLLRCLQIPERYFTSLQPSQHATSAAEVIQKYVGTAERELILSIYDADFETFGYSKDPMLAAA